MIGRYKTFSLIFNYYYSLHVCYSLLTVLFLYRSTYCNAYLGLISYSATAKKGLQLKDVITRILICIVKMVMIYTYEDSKYCFLLISYCKFALWCTYHYDRTYGWYSDYVMGFFLMLVLVSVIRGQLVWSIANKIQIDAARSSIQT